MSKKKKNKMVVYEGSDETLIVIKKDEKKFLKEYFGKDSGRDVDAYERYSTSEPIEIYSRIRMMC